MISSHTHARAEHDTVPMRLGTLETQVMELLWEGEPSTIRELINRLPTDPAYTTIATVLSNLRKKELVCTRKEGHSTLYLACVAREELTTRRIAHALEESGDRKVAMLHFVSTLDGADLDLLRSFLEKRNGK